MPKFCCLEARRRKFKGDLLKLLPVGLIHPLSSLLDSVCQLFFFGSNGQKKDFLMAAARNLTRNNNNNNATRANYICFEQEVGLACWEANKR